MSANRKKRPRRNFRFRTRVENEDPRKADPVKSVAPSPRERRRRRIQFAWLAGKALGLTGAALWLLSRGHQVWKDSFATHPDYAVGTFGYASNVPVDRGGLSRESVLNATGLRADTNVMKVNLSQVRDSILQLPQVREVQVERYFPNRVDIQVEERKPVAWLACGPKDIQPRDTQKGRLLDEHAVVFSCHSLLTQYQYLPVINVPSLAWAESGKALTDRRALQALQLIALFEKQQWPGPLRIVQLEIDSEYSMTAQFSDRSKVQFALDDLELQMDRLAMIYAHSAEQKRAIETVNLLPRKNVPVTYYGNNKIPDMNDPANSTPTPQPPRAKVVGDNRAANGNVVPIASSAATPVSIPNTGANSRKAPRRNDTREQRDIEAILKGH